MRVFVAGGTGAIGRHVVPSLVAAGHEVVALARTPQRAELVAAAGATPHLGDVLDRRTLAGGVDGCDAVVNVASALPPTTKFALASAWATNQRVRTEGSAALVDAALAAGVGTFVQESVSMLYRDGGQAWVDETCPTDRYPIATGNHAAEASAHRFTAAGGRGVVLRFGFFYGPGARHSEQFLKVARLGLVPMLGPPSTYLSSIYTTDAASAVVAALDAPAGVYNVVDDDPVTKREYARALASAVGRRVHVGAPGRLALLLGQRTTSLTRSLRVSNRRFAETTGWRPAFASVREGWPAAAGRRR